VIETDWARAGEAARILGVGSRAVSRLARRGLIGSRTVPGCKPVYSLADCRAIAEATKQKTQGVSSTLGLAVSEAFGNV
jgi:hypothetical protein